MVSGESVNKKYLNVSNVEVGINYRVALSFIVDGMPFTYGGILDVFFAYTLGRGWVDANKHDRIGYSRLLVA